MKHFYKVYSLLLYLTLNFLCITGIVNGIFDDNRYRSDPKKTVLKSVDVLGLGSGSDVANKLKYAESVSSGIVFGRELVNSPANILTPGSLLISCSKVSSYIFVSVPLN